MYVNPLLPGLHYMYVNPLHYQGYTICMLTLYPLHYHGCTICMLTLYPLHYHGYTICMLTLYSLHYHGYTICMLTLYPLHYQGYTIPAGDILMLCPYLSHRNPESFPEPEKFNPVGHLTLVSSPPGMRHMGNLFQHSMEPRSIVLYKCLQQV